MLRRFTMTLMAILAVALTPPAGAENLALNKIVITSTRTETDLQDTPGAITVITAEDIEDQPMRDLVDILAETPGISLSGRGTGGRKTLSIRGAENRHSMLLIDSRRIAPSDASMGHSNYENSWVPVESIERIEIIRGPLSSLYGSEALGGVVNIITRPPTQKWHGGATAGGGFVDDRGGEHQNAGVHLSGPIFKNLLGLSLAAEYINDQMTPDEDDPQTSELEGSEIMSFNGKLTLTPSDNHRVELFTTLIDEDRELRSSNSSGRYYATRYELDKYMAGIGWSGKMGPTESKLNLYRSRINKLSTQRYDDNGSTSETPDIVTNDVLDGQCSLLLAAHRITLGGEYRLEKIEADSLEDAGGEEEVTHKALFLQDEFSFLDDRLLLTPGLRYDHHEYFGSELSPRVYAVFKLTDRFNLKAGYGHAFNAPTAKQVSPGYNASTGPHQILGNPDVKPETSDSYELGVEYFGDTVTAKAFCFRSDVDNLIANNRIGSFGPGGRFGIYQADNIDKARIQGIETELKIDLPYALYLWANYSYLDAEDTKNDEPLPGRPEHSVNLKLAYTLRSLGLHAVLRYQYVGEQSFENDDDRMERVQGYSLWHASVSKTLSNHLDLQLGVENIGDVRLRDDAELYSYEERGRFVYANLRSHF